MTMRAVKMLLGPHPLHTRWRIALTAFGVFVLMFALHWILPMPAGFQPLPLLGMVALYIAVHMLVFRLVHPALVRRVSHAHLRPLNNAFFRWYLSTGPRDQR